MQKLMDEARAHKCEPLMMIGDPEYYDRFFGFSAAATFGWECPGLVERPRLLAQSVDGRALPGPGKLCPRSALIQVACSITTQERSTGYNKPQHGKDLLACSFDRFTIVQRVSIVTWTDKLQT